MPFENGWTASTQCSHLRDRPTQIQIASNIALPTNVYLLLQAGWGLARYNGKQIGEVFLNFSDGRRLRIPLTLGFNIRDWARAEPQAVTTTSSPTVQPAWEGTDNGKPGGMDMLTVDIPSDHSESELNNIQIVDISSATTGDVDPCIHLLAVTVKYLRPIK